MSVSVSVVIPSYKSAPWITATLESVLNQTFPRQELEVIIVDDASPDDGAQVARSVLEGTGLKHRIVMREKNCGVGASRNVGWRMAEGQWIQFLDHDDLLMPHKIALQYEFGSKAADDVGVVYSSWRALDLINGQWQPAGPTRAPCVDDDTVVRIIDDTAFGYVGPTLIRRAAVEKVGGFKESPTLGEDLNLLLRIAMAGIVFREARSQGEVPFLYRQTPDSLWRDWVKDLVALRNLIDTYRDVEDFLRKQPDGLSSVARAALAARYGRFMGLFLERQPDMFDQVLGRLHGLGVNYPPDLNKGMRAVTRAVGFKNALRMRAKVRRMRGLEPY
jgi:glycosyltransferase involved in cell wall biosynthesis